MLSLHRTGTPLVDRLRYAVSSEGSGLFTAQAILLVEQLRRLELFPCKSLELGTDAFLVIYHS